MQVGRRVARLRMTHGESLREAAVRTGVSHTTIARIEKGEVTSSFHSTLQKIAAGYGVRMEFLLTGRDPRRDFERTLQRLPPQERSRLYFLSTQHRVRMVLRFLATEYARESNLEQLVAAAGLPSVSVWELLAQWEQGGLPDEVVRRLTAAVSRRTGISPGWFHWGAVEGEPVSGLPGRAVSAYLHVIRKAARAGIPPYALELAVDVLSMKRGDNKLSSA